MAEPTALQERAAKMVAENLAKGAPQRTSDILAKAGYSPSMASSPTKILALPSFKQLVDKFLPDDYLLNRQKQLIDSSNESVSGKMIELAHKLKGNLGAGDTGVSTININYGNQPSRAFIDGETIDVFDSQSTVRELPDPEHTTETGQQDDDALTC